MQSSDTVCIIFSVRSGMLETHKQVLIFKFGEELSYFVILRYKLRDFIKIFYDYVNGPIKKVFSEDFVTISYRQEKFHET